jgi:molybdopterin synthase catalytic subunit
MGSPAEGNTWVACTSDPLEPGEAVAWAVTPGCGGLVLFLGTVRDHAEGRPEVSAITYEAYEAQVGPALAAVAQEARRRWPELGRLVVQHRVGRLEVRDASVLVVATAPHRPEAFAAARYLIDAIKRTVPIWKRETWSGGEDWGCCAEELTTPEAVPSPPLWPSQGEHRHEQAQSAGELPTTQGAGTR